MKKTPVFMALAALLLTFQTPSYSQPVPPQGQMAVPSQQPSVGPELSKELPVLRKGDSGGAVRLLQNILISLRYITPESRTSNFDEKTQQAVIKFQKQYNLSADGVVGSLTWRMLGGVLWD
ncbi:MAG: peptidoglycan-binding protein [Aphanothece sp. CMT-3BRIN-NPC111]|jgi:peptidoglycan hydrolase-like protein with peptidoglycan-binding domain|nr:peptidoglycan-binding protein [Aphanothece sp. CMT-3BRIN-NPC111]